MEVFRRKGYSDIGRSFPVGNDHSVMNDGKFCGLRYEINNHCSMVQVDLISSRIAWADYRSSDDSTSRFGSYIPSIEKDNGIEYLEGRQFNRRNLCGYWHALMMYYSNRESKIPYDKDYSRDHFALVSFPAKYGASGNMTFITNEDLIVYRKDLGKAEYLDAYPSTT